MHIDRIDTAIDTALEELVPDILCSTFTDDCIARGKHIKEGGAVYDYVSGLQVGISPDIYDNGVRAHWYREAGGEFDRNAPKDYEFEAWDTMALPACWNCREEKYSLYEGSFWFFRTFGDVPRKEGERVILRVGAANYAAMVFVNGIHVASHEGGFTPFCADITAALKPSIPESDGGNRLLVWVSNARRRDAVPADFTDWFNYGGIYRSVGLYLVPPIRIDDWSLSLGPFGDD